MASHELPPAAWIDALLRSDLDKNARLVAFIFARRCTGPVVWVSYPDLMSDTRLSRDTVARALGQLVAGGWLRRAANAAQHHATRYVLAQPSAHRTAERDERIPSRPIQPSDSRTREVLRTSRHRQPSDGRTAGSAPARSRRARPWCGHCDRQSRQLPDDGTGVVRWCPTCKPERARSTA